MCNHNTSIQIQPLSTQPGIGLIPENSLCHAFGTSSSLSGNTYTIKNERWVGLLLIFRRKNDLYSLFGYVEVGFQFPLFCSLSYCSSILIQLIMRFYTLANKDESSENNLMLDFRLSVKSFIYIY